MRNAAGSARQWSHTLSNGVRHRSRFRCLPTLYAATSARPRAASASWVSSWYALTVASSTVRPTRFAWPFVHGW